MIIQNRDGSFAKESRHGTSKLQSYYAVVPTHALDRKNTVIGELISFALDTLGVCHLEVRVYDETATKVLVECES